MSYKIIDKRAETGQPESPLDARIRAAVTYATGLRYTDNPAKDIVLGLVREIEDLRKQITGASKPVAWLIEVWTGEYWEPVWDRDFQFRFSEDEAKSAAAHVREPQVRIVPLFAAPSE